MELHHRTASDPDLNMKQLFRSDALASAFQATPHYMSDSRNLVLWNAVAPPKHFARVWLTLLGQAREHDVGVVHVSAEIVSEGHSV